MTRFRCGIDHDLFSRIENAKQDVHQKYGIPEEKTVLLCVGRVSKEKQVEFLLEVFESVRKTNEDVALLFAGAGPEPYFKNFKAFALKCPDVFFTGRIRRNEMPIVYSAADLLLFPGTTDTFGMAVLEAQACGLPVLVSDKGGPKEIVLDNKTGMVIKALDRHCWVDSICSMIQLLRNQPDRYIEMSNAARNNIVKVYDWQFVLDDLFRYNSGDDVSEMDHRYSTGEFIEQPGIKRILSKS